MKSYFEKVKKEIIEYAESDAGSAQLATKVAQSKESEGQLSRLFDGLKFDSPTTLQAYNDLIKNIGEEALTTNSNKIVDQYNDEKLIRDAIKKIAVPVTQYMEEVQKVVNEVFLTENNRLKPEILKALSNLYDPLFEREMTERKITTYVIQSVLALYAQMITEVAFTNLDHEKFPNFSLNVMNEIGNHTENIKVTHVSQKRKKNWENQIREKFREEMDKSSHALEEDRVWGLFTKFPESLSDSTSDIEKRNYLAAMVNAIDEISTDLSGDYVTFFDVQIAKLQGEGSHVLADELRDEKIEYEKYLWKTVFKEEIERHQFNQALKKFDSIVEPNDAKTISHYIRELHEQKDTTFTTQELTTTLNQIHELSTPIPTDPKIPELASQIMERARALENIPKYEKLKTKMVIFAASALILFAIAATIATMGLAAPLSIPTIGLALASMASAAASSKYAHDKFQIDPNEAQKIQSNIKEALKDLMKPLLGPRESNNSADRPSTPGGHTTDEDGEEESNAPQPHR